MKFLLWALEKLGRKYAVVDFYGDVQLYRYFLFYVEKFSDSRWIAKLPNAYIHVFPGEPGGWGPDGGPDERTRRSHIHPWAAIGIILRGGYTEIQGKNKRKTVTAPGVAYTPLNEHHKIVEVKPGTISLFLHWFRKRDWGSYDYQCETVCENCKSHGRDVSQCLYGSGEKSFPDIDSASKGWREYRVMKVDETFHTMISDRKKALSRMKVQIPITSEEKFLKKQVDMFRREQ